MKSYEFPEDVWTEILLKLPAIYVARLRILSKFHKALIDSPYLTRKHFDGATKTSHVVFKNHGRPDYYMEFDAANSCASVKRLIRPPNSEGHHYVDLVSSCRGILCYQHRENVFLWNPLTGCSRMIAQKGDRKGFWSRYLLGYATINDDLKVLRLTEVENKVYEYDVYSSRNGCWKHVGVIDDISDDVSHQIGMYRQILPDVFVEGTDCVHMYCSISDPKYSFSRNAIAAFNFATEKFNMINLPPECECFIHMEISTWGGCLCFYINMLTSIDVWVMKDYGFKDSWTEIFSLYDSIPCGNIPTYLDFSVPKLFDFGHSTSQLLFLLAPDQLHLYDATNNFVLKNHISLVQSEGARGVLTNAFRWNFTPSLRRL